MISFEKKCIFVHIPRTGGTSIENVIWPPAERRTKTCLWMGFVKPFFNKYQTGGLQHLFARHILYEIGEKTFNEFFKFSIVRNPWDKAVSQFSYMKKRDDLRFFIGMDKDDSFKKYLTLIQKRIHVQWEKQYKFIYDENGNKMIDFVGKFEDFESDVRKILNVLGLNVKKVPHAGKSNRSHYSSYYDDESKQIVEDLYKEDIKLFGYTFSVTNVE